MTLSMEFMVYGLLVGLLTVWLLLPLIPAILLYWLFPDTSVTATGLLANLKVNATGAFAGYLVLFSAMIPFVNQSYDTVGGFRRPYWTVTGQIKIIDKDDKEVHHQPFFQRITFRTHPETNSFQDPIFVLTIPEGERGIPPIILDIPEFGRSLWQLQSKEVIVDRFKKTVEITTPLVIRETPRNLSYDARPR